MTKNIDSTEKLFNHIGKLAKEFGTDVYIVGGYVRDQILGIESKDFDFTVIDNGIEFSKAFAESIGAHKVVSFEKYGTCFIPYKNFKIEFVQARSEKYTPDSRNPIVEKGDLHTDLERRDFTINTLARKVNPDGLDDVIDKFGGLKDLKNGIIRTPLEPEKTFDDDPLRMVRAIRFASKFNFKIVDDAIKAINNKSERIKIVSQERISDEFVKVMLTDKPSVGLDLYRVAGLLKILYPKLEKLIGVEQRKTYHHKDVWFHTLKVVDNIAAVSDKLNLRLAGLYHDIAKPQTKRFVEDIGWTFHGHEVLGAKFISGIIKNQKLNKDLIPYLEKLVRLHLRPIGLSNEKVTDSAIRRLIVDAGEHIDDLMILCRADITSGNLERVKKHIKNFDYVNKRMKEVEESDNLKSFKSPVDGIEIMKSFNLRPSPVIGKIKKIIEDAILDGKIPNEYDSALKYMLDNKSDIFEMVNDEAKAG